MYESTQRGPPPKRIQANRHTHAPTDKVTATRSNLPLYRPSMPRKEIWYDMRHAHQREKDVLALCPRHGSDFFLLREERTAPHRRPQQARNEPENRRRPRGHQHRGTKHGMTDAHTPEGTPLPQTTHTTNASTRRTRGMPGARCPHARKREQHKVWLKARTRHSIVLVLVNKASHSTSLPTRTLYRSPTPWMRYGQMGTG